MIRIDGLSVVFGGVRPLDDLSVVLDADVHGVIGPNGAGKTTLLNVLSGFVLPAAGSVEAYGADLFAMSPRARARWGLRRSFQTDQLADQLSAVENIQVMLDTTPGRNRAHRAEANRMCDWLGIERRHTLVCELDNRERRLTELGRCLVANPRLVLLDEPGAGLSGPELEHLRWVIWQIKHEFGAMVVLVDHDMDLIAGVCGEVCVLDFGRLLANGLTDAVLAAPNVRAAYLGTADVA